MSLKTTFNRACRTPLATAAAGMAVAYVVMMITRVAYFCVNWGTFAPHMSWELACNMLRGGLVFDTSALLYVNSLWLVLVLLPLHVKERAGFHRGLKWLYVATNSLAAASNLADSVYVQYTGRRSTVTVFSEFANENNIAAIVGTEVLNHWYLLLVMALCVWLLCRLYRKPSAGVWGKRWHYYAAQATALAVLAPLAIVGIRGSATAGTRPITISNANEWVNRPIEGTVVLNTPFSLIRSIGKKAFVDPKYMSQQAMQAAFNPELPAITPDSLTLGRKNVVVLILESFGKEYMGFYNSYKGYTPFLDSLASQGLTWQHSYANGRISMDAMPSVLSGIPMMVEPFFLTPASLNDVDGLPRLLKPQGYSSAFFHGAHNISMGFSAFAHSIGYEKYYGLDEYCRSDKHGGMSDFDGKWAIWDGPFLQYMLDELHGMRQPFLASAFTASSHHPYKVPKGLESHYPDEGGLPIHRVVRYSDDALRQFFARASREPWYRNTLFVIVADHTNLNARPEYDTPLSRYAVPIIFYTPDGSLRPQLRRDQVAQQADITPTLLHLLGVQRPIVAWGCDLMATPADSTWAFSYNNGVYQIAQGELLLQFDGHKTTGVYRFRTDPMLRHNLVGTLPGQAPLELRLKAMIQQYMQRMTQNRLVMRPETSQQQ